jgi:hypothetical protein
MRAQTQVRQPPKNSCMSLTCADENRARVVASNYLSPVILELNDTSLLPFAIPVLYNICIDYGLSIPMTETQCTC